MDNKENILSDFEARKRDHKIYISDEAIAKVPFIKYREIPKEHYDNLYNLAKEVLEESKLHNNSNEVAIVYSLDFFELVSQNQEYMGIAYGDEHDVNVGGSTESYHILRTSYDCVVVCLHNHPNLSKISLQDVQYLLKFDNIKMIVVVTNLGSISYLVKAKNYDRNDAIKVYREAINIQKMGSDLKNLQRAANYFLKECYRANLVYEDR